jgi:CRISPR-associated protein Cas2
MMWLMVMFDLPMDTEDQKKSYNKFRKALLRDNFDKFQYSVYARYCGSVQNVEAAKRRLYNHLPLQGKVSFWMFTDRQLAMMENIYCGQLHAEKPRAPEQLMLF